MKPSNNERIGQSLTLLSQALSPYVKEKMTEKYPNDWLSKLESVSSLKKNKKKSNPSDKKILPDVLVLLKTIDNYWEEVFKNDLSPETRGFVILLIEVRNTWAHNSDFSPQEASRALDYIYLLLEKIEAEQEKIVVDDHREIVSKLAAEKKSNFTPSQISQADEKIREQLKELLERIPFQDARLLLRALTHRSYVFENPTKTEGDNEQLEFLGDSVLQFLAGDYVYEKYFGEAEGKLTQNREKFVSNEALAILAQDFNLGKWIKLGKGEELKGGRTNPSLLSNTFEAVIGAYYKDSGVDAVWEWLKPMLEKLDTIKIENDYSEVSNDAKNRFQHWAITNHQKNPEYIVIRESGDDHNKVFVVEARVNGIAYSQGEAKKKKDAEKQAATKVLKKLGLI
jgi:ribonuclease III